MTAPNRQNGVLATTRLKGCESKNRYSDEFGCRAAGQSLEKKNKTPLYMYPCGLCRGWHLTKSVQRDPTSRVTYDYSESAN